MQSPKLDHSLHDAYIESVCIGPRREVQLELHLGSSRVSDPELPVDASLRLAAIDNFDEAQRYFESGFPPGCTGRIDCVTVTPGQKGSCFVKFEVDPQGVVEVVCSKLKFESRDPE